MLNTLIESRRRKDRRSGETVVSVVLHAALIVLAVVMTAEAKNPPAHTPSQPEVIYRAVVKPAEQPTPATRTRAVVKLPPTGHIVHVIVPPTTIPTTLPAIDPAAPVVDERDFNNVRVSVGAADGTGSTTPAVDGTYAANQVEKQTLAYSTNAKPQYPSTLESAHVDGQVLIQFVVDTAGRVDMSTLKVLQATNALFADAVRRVLPKWRFYPAETGGHKVKQLVQMPLAFKLP